MRLATTALFVVTVWLTWLVAAELLAATWARFLATAFVALQPKLGFGAGIINPDMMLVLTATGALLMALRLVRAGPALRPRPRPGGVRRRRRPRRIRAGSSCRRSRSSRWSSPSCATGPDGGAAAVASAARARRHVRLPAGRRPRGRARAAAALASNPVGGFSPKQFLSYLWQFYLPKLSFMSPEGRAGDLRLPPGLHRHLLQRLGVADRQLPRWSCSTSCRSPPAIGLVALWTTVVARWRIVVARWPEVLVCVTFFAGLMALLHIVSYLNLRGSTDPVLNGRYLLPAVRALRRGDRVGCLLAAPAVGIAVGGALLGVALLLAIGGIGLSLDRFYA